MPFDPVTSRRRHLHAGSPPPPRSGPASVRRARAATFVLASLVLLLGGRPGEAQRSRAAAEKLHQEMRRLLDERGPAKGWVFFTDKALRDVAELERALADARDALAPRTRARRALRRLRPGLVDATDVPVAEAYVDAVRATGAELSVRSSWLNAVSVTGTRAQFDEIAGLPFVDRVEPVRRGRLTDGWDGTVQEASPGPAGPAVSAAAGFYGETEEQLTQIDLLAVHQRGFTGSGVVLGILDTGFHRGHEAFNQPGHVVNVLAEYDFVNDDPNTDIEGGDDPSQHSHGTYILGTIAAYLPNELVGGAYDASFILCKTEDITDEYQQEEDFYVAGLQFIEANGGDVATSSLGYIDWYTQADLDGLTAVTTIGVNIATGNGVHCCTAAGNSGHDADPLTSHLIAPADAFEVLTAGAVDSLGIPASFTSDGPSADQRVKPELLARGVDTRTVCAFTDVDCTTGVSGTSLSTPLLAALVTCLTQAHPGWSVPQLRQRLFNTGDYFLANGTFDPEYVLGYGIPDTDRAGFDCNGNGVDDELDVLNLTSCDCNGNGEPDECDIADGISADLNGDGRPDECTDMLTGTPASLSLTAGGKVVLCFHAGAAYAGRHYLLLGSASGDTPGFDFGGMHVPLQVDGYFRLLVRQPTSGLLVGARGALDGEGGANASVTVPAGTALLLAGATLRHVVVVPEEPTLSGGPLRGMYEKVGLELVSNTVTVDLVP